MPLYVPILLLRTWLRLLCLLLLFLVLIPRIQHIQAHVALQGHLLLQLPLQLFKCLLAGLHAALQVLLCPLKPGCPLPAGLNCCRLPLLHSAWVGAVEPPPSPQPHSSSGAGCIAVNGCEYQVVSHLQNTQFEFVREPQPLCWTVRKSSWRSGLHFHALNKTAAAAQLPVWYLLTTCCSGLGDAVVHDCER
jgi:hypothetical protein